VSGFIEDDAQKPNAARQVVRWLLVVVMLLCVYQIGVGLYGMKNDQAAIRAVWALVRGSFFFILSYAAHWLLRD
jgi:membrane protein YdbS with pleckstrin-like domain